MYFLNTFKASCCASLQKVLRHAAARQLIGQGDVDPSQVWPKTFNCKNLVKLILKSS